MPERADVLQIGLRLFVQRLWHCAKDIGGLVDPAPLLTRGREDIPQRRPEPERTVHYPAGDACIAERGR